MEVGRALVAAGHEALPATIATLLVLSVVSALLAPSRWNPRALSLLLVTLACVAILALGIVALVGGQAISASAGSVLGFAVVHVRYDGLSGLFLVALGIVGGASTVYGLGYEPQAGPPDRTRAAYPVFIASLALVFGADDAVAFLLAWELMALSSALLVVGAQPSPDTARTGYVYLTLTHLATAALVVGFGLLAAAAGSTDVGTFGAAAASMSPEARSIVFVLLLIGFGTKAGAIPLHVWLPRAHPVAPSHVSALMSGVMIKTGIYGLVRFGLEILGPGPEWWGLVVLAIGVVSAVLGILYALMEHDLKRLLAFSSIENIGLILMGVGVAMIAAAADVPLLATVGLAAALFHAVNHALFKSALFLAAGSIESGAGSRDLNRLGGLARAMPATALALGVGAVAIGGLPPLNGFASEWLTFQALIGAGGEVGLSQVARSAGLLAVAGLALAVALALAAFVKATGMSLLALPRSPGAAAAREQGRSMRGAMLVLVVACVVAGVAAAPLADGITRLSGSMLGLAPAAPTVSPAASLPGLGGVYAPAPLAVLLAGLLAVTWRVTARSRRTRRVPTWTTGVAPEAKFEYTATSFAKLIRLYFGPLLRPERDVTVELHPGTPFPRSVRYRGRVSHVLDERLYGPLHAVAVGAAQLIRRLQSGSLQLYLAYSVTALVVLLLVARA